MTLRKPLALDPTYGTPSEMSSTTDTLVIGQVSAAGIGGVSFNANGGSIANLAAPVNPNDGVTKAYVDALSAGLSVKASVRAMSTTNVASLSGAQTLDGVACGAGTRVLLTGQSTATQNGIWVVQSGSWTRPADFATGNSEAGAYVFIDGGGTMYGGGGWICNSVPGSDVVDTSSLAFTQFTGLGEVTAGNGLSKSANTIQISLANNPGLQFTGNQLDHFLTPAGGLSKSATGLQVLLNGPTLASTSSGVSVVGVPLQFQVAGVATDSNVTAANLSALNDGPTSLADSLHQHARVLASQITSAVHAVGSVAVAAGDPVQWSSTSNTLSRCDAAALATSQCIGIAGAAIAASGTGVIVKRGIAVGVLSGATPGTPYFIASGGGLSAGFPSGSAVSVTRVGHAVNATDLEVNPAQIGTRSPT